MPYKIMTKQQHLNFIGSTQESDSGVVMLFVLVGGIVYLASKGVSKVTKSKNTLTNIAFALGALIIYAKIEANKSED